MTSNLARDLLYLIEDRQRCVGERYAVLAVNLRHLRDRPHSLCAIDLPPFAVTDVRCANASENLKFQRERSDSAPLANLDHERRRLGIR